MIGISGPFVAVDRNSPIDFRGMVWDGSGSGAGTRKRLGKVDKGTSLSVHPIYTYLPTFCCFTSCHLLFLRSKGESEFKGGAETDSTLEVRDRIFAGRTDDRDLGPGISFYS